MHNGSSTTRIFTLAAIVAALLLSGCESTSNWLKGRRTATPTDDVILGSADAGTYLSELAELISGDPATQAEIFADSQSAAMLTPDPSTRLRYALVIATPGHSESNDAEAQRLLREILSQPEMMTSSEIALATIFQRDVETRLVLDSESRRLRSENTRATTTEEAAVAQRMSRIEAQNRRLREVLASPNSRPSLLLSDLFASNPEKTIRNSSHRAIRCRLR